MKLFKKRNGVLFLLGLGLIALIVVYLPQILKFISSIFSASLPLLIGAGLAYILNLIMDPVARFCAKSDHPILKKHAQTFGMITSVVVTLLVVVLIIVLVVPNVYEAVKVVMTEAPGYLKDLKAWLVEITKDNPALSGYINTINVDVEESLKHLGTVASGSLGGVFTSTIDLLSGVAGGLFNLFVIIVFALFVLGSKDYFVRVYHLLCRLYLSPKHYAELTRDLRILNNCYKNFILGSIILAALLIVILAVVFYVLQIPYALMIAVIIGVINIIPMVGAFIGGGISFFIVFTASPIKALIFLVLLCVIQEISSNVFFPKIIGDKVGLPGIYVMITIIIGGALYGIAGMILGIPLVAAIYRIIKLHLENRADRQGIHKDPLVQELHESNMKVNDMLQKEATAVINGKGGEYIVVQREENIMELDKEPDASVKDSQS